MSSCLVDRLNHLSNSDVACNEILCRDLSRRQVKSKFWVKSKLFDKKLYYFIIFTQETQSLNLKILWGLDPQNFGFEILPIAEVSRWTSLHTHEYIETLYMSVASNLINILIFMKLFNLHAASDGFYFCVFKIKHNTNFNSFVHFQIKTNLKSEQNFGYHHIIITSQGKKTKKTQPGSPLKSPWALLSVPVWLACVFTVVGERLRGFLFW